MRRSAWSEATPLLIGNTFLTPSTPLSLVAGTDEDGRLVDVSAATLNGNAHLVSGLVEAVGTLAERSGEGEKDEVGAKSEATC